MFFCRGKVRGVSIEHRGKKQEYTFHYLVLETIGFKIHKLQLPDALCGEQFLNQLGALEGKEVDAPVSIRQYLTGKGDNKQPAMSFNYEDIGLPKLVPQIEKPLAKAS